jgi:DNA-binding NtrC family response regulator
MLTVLVIDRDKTRLASAATLLARCGYCALSARDDQAALSLLADMPVQAVIAQVVPGEPAHAALVETIRARFPDLPVVALREPYSAAALVHAVGRCLTDDRVAA